MPRISEFRISNLFGYQNVNLVTDDNVLILMGENGLGKTTILNCLYYTLSQKWSKLSEINFEFISVGINDQKFSIHNEVLKSWIKNKSRKYGARHREIAKEIFKYIDREELIRKRSELEDQPEKNPFVGLERYILRELRKTSSEELAMLLKRYPSRLIMEILEYQTRTPEFSELDDFETYLESAKLEILYFPTYRRVEEELHNLGRSDLIERDDEFYQLVDDEIVPLQSEDDILIQFGMQDVEKRIQTFISQINDSSIKGFTKATGEMLHQLQEGFPKISKRDIEQLDETLVEIILNRVRNSLSEEDRENILDLLKNNKLDEKPELTYFLLQLQSIYLEQQFLDDAIKKFEKVCNSYLVEKAMTFDESLVTLKIINKRNDQVVELSNLSSGEKQIVSLFSKLYLEQKRDLLIFFDEPELSLSMNWQRKLLPHVLETNRCSFLLAVTHSPFIFDNELSDKAIGMNLFID